MLKRLDVGPYFGKWVDLLSQNQVAKVKIKDKISQEIIIKQSVQQGCQLSPLLFNVGLEVLMIAIRSHESIEGIKLTTTELKLALYADDMACFFFFKKEIL